MYKLPTFVVLVYVAYLNSSQQTADILEQIDFGGMFIMMVSISMNVFPLLSSCSCPI